MHPVDKTNPERARQQDMSAREWQLRNFGNEPARPTDRKRLEALMAQTEEDFTRILTLHNEFARAISADKTLNYDFVSEAASEINKRANRLQSTLVLQPLEDQPDEKSEEFNETQIKDALVTLCKQIRSFVTNPIIETPNTVEAGQLMKARRDLQNLVLLSDQIKKSAKKLSKTQK
jgi:hypothetical protein